MREIKFRAWGKLGKRMYYPPSDATGLGVLADFIQSHSGKYGFNADGDSILMQYTGLKDKNGKEIYEGDVLKVDNSLQVSCWMRGDICTVKALPGRFKLENKAGDGNMMQEDMQDVVEIIGNIYENPELLGTIP